MIMIYHMNVKVIVLKQCQSLEVIISTVEQRCLLQAIVVFFNV